MTSTINQCKKDKKSPIVVLFVHDFRQMMLVVFISVSCLNDNDDCNQRRFREKEKDYNRYVSKKSSKGEKEIVNNYGLRKAERLFGIIKKIMVCFRALQAILLNRMDMITILIIRIMIMILGT